MNTLDPKTLTPTILASAYNELAATPVKRFADLAAAVRRTAALLEEKGYALVCLAEGGALTKSDGAVRLSIQPTDRPDGVAVYLVSVKAIPAPAPKPVAKAPAPAVQRGPVSEVPETAKITVLVKENPKRARGRAAKRFALYRTGMTVGEYLTAARELDQHAPRSWYRADIRWDIAHGFISTKQEG